MIYWRFCDLFKNYVIYWRIQRFIRDFCNLLEISVILCVDLLKTSVIYWRILRLIGDFWDLLKISVVYWRNIGEFRYLIKIFLTYWIVMWFVRISEPIIHRYMYYMLQLGLCALLEWMNKHFQADRIHALFIVNIKVWNSFWKR